MLAEFDFRVLAHVDAVLNGIATALIVSGLIAIKRGAVAVHKALMLAAAGVSAVFLACYLTYHLSHPEVHFTGTGWIRSVYYPLLISHIVLAVVQVPLILRTIWLGLKDRRAQHRKWAKVTAPIWLYVSVTGVVYYLILYHW